MFEVKRQREGRMFVIWPCNIKRNTTPIYQKATLFWKIWKQKAAEGVTKAGGKLEKQGNSTPVVAEVYQNVYTGTKGGMVTLVSKTVVLPVMSNCVQIHVVDHPMTYKKTRLDEVTSWVAYQTSYLYEGDTKACHIWYEIRNLEKARVKMYAGIKCRLRYWPKRIGKGIQAVTADAGLKRRTDNSITVIR